MEFKLVEGSILVIIPEGDVTDKLGPEPLRELSMIRALLQGRISTGTMRVIINCCRMNVINSTGLGVIVKAHISLTEQGGRLVLTRIDERFTRLLKTTKLDRVLEVYATEEEAIAALCQPTT